MGITTLSPFVQPEIRGDYVYTKSKKMLHYIIQVLTIVLLLIKRRFAKHKSFKRTGCSHDKVL